MRPRKKFLVAPVLLVVLVPVVSVIPSQVVVGSRRNVRGTIQGHQGSHRPMTIWERMRDPRGWWRSRLLDRSAHPQANSRFRSSWRRTCSPSRGAITNPVFSSLQPMVLPGDLRAMPDR